MLLSEMLSKNALKRFELKRTCLFIYFRIKNYLSTVAWGMYTWGSEWIKQQLADVFQHPRWVVSDHRSQTKVLFTLMCLV